MQAKALETKYLERAARLKKGHEEQVEALKRTAELDAEERTDASIQRILTQNKNLTDELAIHVEASHGFACKCILHGQDISLNEARLSNYRRCSHGANPALPKHHRIVEA